MRTLIPLALAGLALAVTGGSTYAERGGGGGGGRSGGGGGSRGGGGFHASGGSGFQGAATARGSGAGRMTAPSRSTNIAPRSVRSSQPPPIASRNAANVNRIAPGVTTQNRVINSGRRAGTRGFSSHSGFAFPSGEVTRNWDRSHSHHWNNHNWRWHNGGWVAFGASPYYYGYGGYDYAPPYSDYGAGYSDYGTGYSDYGPSPDTYSYPQEPGPAPDTYSYSQQPGSTVEDVQSRLAQDGYYSGPIDGVIGPQTRSAVSAYQRDHNLPVNGSLNQALLSNMGLQ